MEGRNLKRASWAGAQLQRKLSVPPSEAVTGLFLDCSHMFASRKCRRLFWVWHPCCYFLDGDVACAMISCSLSRAWNGLGLRSTVGIGMLWNSAL